MSFLDPFQKLWKTWEIRGFLLFSFSLQCILILTASMRKRTSSKMWIGLIWLAYLCADWSAYYAIGLIPSPRTSVCEYDKYSDLHAFWAPFLLLHIGGPTTIAAFSLEDNETWSRSVLHLGAQSGLTLFIIYRAIIPHYRNPLLTPTLLMFVAAFTRYLERVLALYYASANTFRDSAIKNVNYGKDILWLSSTPSRDRDKLSEVQMVKESHFLFQTYKTIFGDMPIVFNRILRHGRHYLVEVLNTEEVFTMMEIQMNLAYDIFYTKTWLILETKAGNILHTVSLCSELVALVLWFVAKKQRYSSVDVQLTNTLVLGGLAVDVLSCFKLIFSDFMIPKLAKLKWVGDSYVYILKKALKLREHEFWSRWLMISRWSKTIPQFNLIREFIMKDQHKRKNLVNKLIESYLQAPPNRFVRVSDDVKRRIFKQIKDKLRAISRTGRPPKLSNLGFFMDEGYMWKDFDSILSRTQLVDGLLLCHLATELLHKEDPYYKTEVARQISEYLMCHFFDANDSMVAKGAIRQILYDGAIRKEIIDIYTGQRIGALPDDIQELLMGLDLTVDVDSKSQAMFVFGQYIKDHLVKLEKQSAAATIEDIWVGLLCSTAIQCTGRSHLEGLSKGGEFLTVVWLLLTQVGLTPNMDPSHLEAEMMSTTARSSVQQQN